MAQQNHLVGIIELDAAPEWNSIPDKDIGQTLHRLCTANPGILDSEDADRSHASTRSDRQSIRTGWDDAIVARTADLQQLNCDLESELVWLFDRLFAMR